ncbi:MAG: acetoacetate--CoA ligase [Myxococcales bacterium]|nr:acetoacetate--CoA ligase [Myxococcales bacterium]
MTKEPLWRPSPARVAQAQITQYAKMIQEQTGQSFRDYWDLHAWSVRETAAFWESIWKLGEVEASQPYTQVWEPGADMLSSRWFSGARLNFAENLLQGDDDAEAILFHNEIGTRRVLTYAQLRDQVARLARWMKQQGVQMGDRVAAYMPNIPETIVGMLAATSLGAIWSSTSPDFGERGVLDRFGQIEPKILLTTDGYTYKGKPVRSLDRIPRLIEAIPSIEHVLVVGYLDEIPKIQDTPKATSFQDALSGETTSLTFTHTPFDHPLYILYSSGTTGVPKCIVHGVGGTLLQHIKEQRLHTDLRPSDRFFYFTTCGWMMWNWLVSGLASKATLVLFEGSPFHPSEEVLWKIAEEEKLQFFGTSAKYLAALEKTGLKPKERYDLSSLRAILSTGSPLSDASFHYVYRDIKEDLHLASISGGTDIISCFMLGNPTLPVYSEEIQCAGLGMDVQAWSDDGQPVQQEKGELVCVKPFPSQPVGFWQDEDGSRYRGAYFEHFPDIWRHGDLIEFTEHHGVTIYGRSDATLNPGGVRIGTAEIYRAIEPLPEVLDSLVVGRDIDNDVEVILFVKLAPQVEFSEELAKKLRDTIRKETTPRHVPAHLIPIADIPYTISGKKVEIAVRRILHGKDVPNKDALANPQALELYRDLPQLK